MKTVRITNMTPSMRANCLTVLTKALKTKDTTEGQRNLKRFRVCVTSLINEEEWIPYTQYQTILMCVRQHLGYSEALKLEYFVRDNKRLNVFLDLGD
jgi:hypothetical protein